MKVYILQPLAYYNYEHFTKSKVAIVHKYSKKVKKMYAYTGHIYRAYLKVEDRLIGHGRQRDGRDGADVVAQVVTDLKLKWKR